MNLHQLRVFDAVARFLNYSRAAEELSLSQPTVSFHLQKFQDELGVILIEQLGKKIHLTPAGELLFQYSQKIFNLAAEAEHSLNQHIGATKGQLKIGASSTPGIYLLPKLLSRFKIQNPGVDLHFEVANSTEIAAKVASNDLDFGIIGQIDNPNSKLVFTALWDDKIAAILSPANPLACKDVLEPFDFMQHDLILRETGSATRQIIESSFNALGFSLVSSMEFSSTEGVKHAVAANLGISLVSATAISLELAAKALVQREVAGLEITRQFFLIRHCNKLLAPLYELFLDFITKATLE